MISPARRVLWIYDDSMKINTLVPVTNFHNELMISKGIRDPRIALEHRRFFDDLETYSDGDLRTAFARYNQVHRKVEQSRVDSVDPRQADPASVLGRLRGWLGGGR